MKIAKSSLFFVVPFLLLAILLTAMPAMAQEPNDLGTDLLVNFPAGTTEDEARVRVEALGGELVDYIPQIAWAQVRLPEVAAAKADQVQESLGGLKVEPLGSVRLIDDLGNEVGASRIITDSNYNSPATNWGFTEIGGEQALNAPVVITDVKVAVIDTGVQLTHPEFIGRVLPGYNYIKEGSIPFDDNGHGTHVTGIIARVCDVCLIDPRKVFGRGGFTTDFFIARAVVDSVNAGDDVINMSLGSIVTSTILISSTDYAWSNNVLVVAAAGNSGYNTEFYPAGNPNVVGVSAIDLTGHLAFFSSFGKQVDLAGPGANIYSTIVCIVVDNCHGFLSGTSMASPFVAGVAAKMRSATVESVTVASLVQCLILSATDRGEPGRDDKFGWGIVNAPRAIGCLTGEVPPRDPHVYMPVVRNGEPIDDGLPWN